MMKTIGTNKNSNVLLARGFNVFLIIECCGGNPSFKQKFVAKLIEIIDF